MSGGDCSGAEVFALRVLGSDMAPEFEHGEVIVVEPEGAVGDGCFVVARVDDGFSLRQLVRRGNRWALRTLNPARGAAAEQPLHDLAAVRGVVIQKAVPGQRARSKFYL
jgi:SOS-response transcriptional repressor LexA